MGEGVFGEDNAKQCEDTTYQASIEIGQTISPWTTMRCQRVYGCIECRNTMSYMGADNQNRELFQCHNKQCSMHMKVLMIDPPMVDARIIAP